MESDERTQQIIERALHLAAEVAETDDSNVPVLLLQLKGTLFYIFFIRISVRYQEVAKFDIS